MTARTTLALAAEDRQAAVRKTDRGPVDPVELLLAIHTAGSLAELAAARRVAIQHLGVIGGYVWRDEADGCPVRTGEDALALGCMVDRHDPTDDEQGDEQGDASADLAPGRLVHVAHSPLQMHTRIAWLSARAESRLTGRGAPDHLQGRRTA